MTLPSTPRRAGPFNGNGSATSFAFTFKVFSDEDIRVVLTSSVGVETALVLDSHYSVTLNGDQEANPGGSVTYPISGTPLPAGAKLTIAGALEYDQPTDIPDGGNFSPTALENALDRISMQIQQLAEENDRSVRLPVSVSGVSVALPTPQADELLVWNSDATALTNKSVTELATTVAYANWRTSLFDGTGSQTAFTLAIDPVNINNLDVTVSGVPQRPVEDYTLSGVTLTFSTAPPAGTKNVMVRYGEALPTGITDASAVTYRWTDSSPDPYSVEDALREEYVLERAYKSTDLGKWGPAFARLAANPDCRVIKVAATQQNVFNVDAAVAIDRSDLTIYTPGRWGATINLEGSDPYVLDFGGASTVRFNNYLRNLILTRSSTAASGAMIRLRNVYYWGYHNCRLFMDNKAWRGMEIVSSSYGRSYENSSEFPIREHIYMAGGAGDAGSAGGWVVSNQWKGLTIEGGHAATANPLDQGCILMDDHVSACWFIDVEGYRHKGYLVYGKGTLANRSRNILNLIWNPNVECTFANSGTVRLDNYVGNQIRKGWSEGNDCAAIWLTANAQSNIVSDMQIGLKGVSGYGVRDAGTNNTRNNMEYVAYTSGADTPTAGLRYDSTVERPIDTEFTVLQTTLGVSSAAGSTANVNIRQMRYKSLVSGPFDSNLQAASNATIDDVVSQDDAATPFVTAAATLSLFPGYRTYFVDGTTAIDNMAAGYMGEVRMLRLRTAGGSVRDLNLSGGNISLAVASSTFTSAAGRGALTLQWDGTYWSEVGRNG